VVKKKLKKLLTLSLPGEDNFTLAFGNVNKNLCTSGNSPGLYRKARWLFKFIVPVVTFMGSETTYNFTSTKLISNDIG